MKPLFTCELEYVSSPHLSQIYDGFEKLRNSGLINFSIKSFDINNAQKPLLKVKINGAYTVIYDTLDGLNWINGSTAENLNYFKNNTYADFYFKRSFNKQVLEYAPNNCKVYPLGLNYAMKTEDNYPLAFKERIKDIFKNNYYTSKIFKLSKNAFYSKNFEFYPVPSKENKVLCLTRLWNPDDVTLGSLKTEREDINKIRIACIKSCQKEFGKYFIGGLQKDSFSIRHSKELLMPFSLTQKSAFLKTIKENNICIATTGLHNSIGWKFGEYVAASRAIISEPLKYDLPGEFENGSNYLTYNTVNDLMDKIFLLQNNKDLLQEMMINNFHYYNNYLRPDALVLNTLLTIYQNS